MSGQVLLMRLTGMERVRYLMMSSTVSRSETTQASSNEGSLRVSMSSQLWCSLECERRGPQWTRSFAVRRGPSPVACSRVAASSRWGEDRLPAAVRGLSSAKARVEGCQEFLLFIFPSLALWAGAQCRPHVSYYFTRLP